MQNEEVKVESVEEVDTKTTDNGKDDSGILSDLDAKREAKKAEKKKRKRLAKQICLPIVGALILVFMLNIIILPLTGSYQRVNFAGEDNHGNQYIKFGGNNTMISAHRAGGDLEPEETMAAFKLCMQAEYVDILEFDLHLTKDGYLVLMHDHEVDRTSNGPKVFGKKGVKIQDKTLEELKQLNFGYNFKDEDGNYKYREEGADLTDVRILALDEILTYLEGNDEKGIEGVRPDGDLNYIIEIKDNGAVGKKAMDMLYAAMKKYDIIDRTIVGTFQGDITKYIDDKYSDEVKRSAGILEVLNFYYAFLWGVKQNPDKLGYDVLQIPMGLNGFFDFSTVAFIDYAHSLGIAVQYWTINNREDIIKLAHNGADAIMTDNPALMYELFAEGLLAK